MPVHVICAVNLVSPLPPSAFGWRFALRLRGAMSHTFKSRPASAPLLSAPLRRSPSYYYPDRSASAWSKGAYVEQDPCGKLLREHRQGVGDRRGLLDPNSPMRPRLTSEGALELPSRKSRPASAIRVRSKVLEASMAR